MQSNIDWILSKWKEDTVFPALAFAQNSGCENMSSCVRAFEQAVIAIGGYNIKKSRPQKNCILWARKIQAKAKETLDTISVRRFFYLKTREHHMTTKKCLKVQLKKRTTEAELSMLEGSLSSSNSVAEAPSSSDNNNNGNIMTAAPSLNSSGSVLEVAPSSFSTSANLSSAESSPPVSNGELMLESMFEKLDPAKKWILSTGKCVDNELYMFGLQCTHDHPSKSLIMDPDDANYTKYNVFTPAELEEIRTYNEKKLPLMTSDLKNHLLAFNKSNAKDIRNVLKANNTFDDKFDSDEDWINCTMYSILRQYEAGNMMKPHCESWFQSHIWSMIENAFDVFKDVDAVVGESVSHASRKRKNANRHISSLGKMDPVQFGHRLDMIFRQNVADQSEAMEFGGSEAGIKDSGGCGTKYLYERMYKLPRALKDMLDRLYENMPNTYHLQYNQLRTVGFIHSGLNSQMISLDRPTMYSLF
ncbi:hypothetical protein [Parasitella parasitica]|uniref:Uncharacterized protein n=1 Tax=Parasitella parasitica TaxID=35722 RepID=A0A0B7N5R5_9FUNG|nr:hypothetical protein [Parasitella parasitica]